MVSSPEPYTTHTTVSPSFPHSKSNPHKNVFLLYDMDDLSGSIHFRMLFETALLAYEMTTGISLVEHPLTLQLQSCGSIESIAALLQDQIRGSSDLHVNIKIMNLIKSTTSILSTLSTTAAFDWAIDLVRQKAPVT